MAKGSPLIAGSFIQEGPMGVKTVKAIRGFYYDGKQIKVGDVITVPSLFAIGIIAVNKATEVIAEVKPVVEESKPISLDIHNKELMESASENILSKSRGGKKDVR